MSPAVWIVVAVVVIVAIAAAILLGRRGARMRALPDESRARYADTWRMVETRFVDKPREAVDDADALAVSILRERGARMDDGRRVPSELAHARDLANGHHDHQELSETEGLRRAMVAYQRIVDDAVGTSTRRAAEARRPEVTG